MDEQVEQPEYGFKQEAADDSRGSAPWVLLPIMLVVRPGRFFLSWGIHTHLFWFIFAAWVVGSGRMGNWVMNQQRLDAEAMPFKIESWTTLWLVLLGAGILRGVAEYGLGGLWTWLRLRICGVRGNQWHRSTRIYTYARLVEMVPELIFLAYITMRYSGLREYINQPVGVGNYIAGAFFVFSPIVAFVGVIGCYRVRKVWAAALFLIWPIFWRVALIVGALIYLRVANVYMGPYPDTKHPVAASTNTLDFEYPSDWTVSFPEDEGSPVEATIESDNGEGSLVIRVQSRDSVDLIAYDIEQIQGMGYTITKSTPEPRSAMGKHSGQGVDYHLEKDGKQYRMYHLLSHFDVDHDVLFRALSSKRYWEASKRGVMPIVNSLSIGDLYKIVPDIDQPMFTEIGEFSFQAPGNWHLNEYDGSYYTGLQMSAKQYSWMVFDIYDRDMSPKEELDMYLKHSIDDVLVSQTSMNSWLGLNGVGAQGKLRETLAGDQHFKALYVPLVDGRILVLKKYQAMSSSDRTDPGFELIESTFKLLVEPAKP